MAGIQISGLISGSFDWKSVVDQLIQIESTPVARLQTEESKNIDRLAALSTLQTRLTDLQAASTALGAAGLFSGRTAASNTTGSNWSTSAASGTTNGTYSIAVTQLATATRISGSNAISAGISATDSVVGVTLASMATATAVTAGSFTVNGKKVTIALTDSLDDVFGKIATETGGTVSASYSASTDKITFATSNGSPVVFGAANDTSNFLSALRLSNNGLTSVTSSSALGSASLSLPLASSRLRSAITNVDGTGAGAFSINGVNIDYNVNTDSLSAVLARITASDAGVVASYDSTSDRVLLTNKTTGDVGLGIDETPNGLLAALGLVSGSTLARGNDARFSVDGGATLSSHSNNLDGAALGIAGLAVSVGSLGTQTVTVKADNASMNTAIQNFITKFNAVQAYIDSQTKITKTPDGKVSAALLADNREVQTWASQLRSLAFGQVSGLTGSIQRLSAMGIDFSSFDSTLSVKNQGTLDAALSAHGEDVAAFFNSDTTGFAAKFNDFLTSKLTANTGPLAAQMSSINKANASIDRQIITLNQRLANQRELLTSAFLSMQNAQSRAQQQQQTLSNFFDKKTSS
ncbi:MAG: flagellar filament capping protein FliD [Opitutus sp.]